MTAINPQAVRGPVTAVPVVAGKGVRLREDVENNRVVAEADETVLFENATAVTSGNLSETPANFEYIKVYCNRTGGTTTNNLAGYTEVLTRDGVPQCFTILAALHSLSSVFQTTNVFSLSAGSFALDKAFNVRIYSGGLEVQSGEFTNVGILKIVGVNRVASA